MSRIVMRALLLIVLLSVGALPGWSSPVSAQGFARECPPIAVGTQERAVRLETGTLTVVRGAVFALRIAMNGTDFQPDDLHFVRVGSSLFGGALFDPSMGISRSQSDPALRFVVDELLFAELLVAGAIDLVAGDGAHLSVPLAPSALLEARTCIDRYTVPLLEASDARGRDPRSVLRLLPDQHSSVRSMATRPVYPEHAIRDGREGTTVTRLTIGTSGRATACEIARSSSWSDLDAAACAGISSWIFYPATDAEGVPVEAKVNQSIEWQLDQFRE